MTGKAKVTTHIDEEKLYQGIEYLRQGIQTILDLNNPGYLTAFPNKYFNQNGFTFSKKPFFDLCKELDVLINMKDLPEVFDLSVKYSPIAQFKKWIFVISNRRYLMVSQRSKEFEHEFFLFYLEGQLVLQPVITNIAHEKFLLNLYEREKILETTVAFSTFFDASKKLILYKDYAKRKVSAVKLSQVLTPARLYLVKVTFIKSNRVIKYRFSVNLGKRMGHNIRLSGADAIKEKKTVDKISQAPSKSFKSVDDYQVEVLELLNTFKKTPSETNKFANISLGRINKIPILINLSSKYKNISVVLNFTKKKELVVLGKKGEVVKVFGIAKTPKSNWLEKK